jgi:hypothetical protein
VTGPKLQATFKGIDYIYFRADGRAELHIHGQITTEDGKKIALEAGGAAIPEKGSPVFQLREHVSLMSNHPGLSRGMGTGRGRHVDGTGSAPRSVCGRCCSVSIREGVVQLLA